jgi:hypothetical protein
MTKSEIKKALLAAATDYINGGEPVRWYDHSLITVMPYRAGRDKEVVWEGDEGPACAETSALFLLLVREAL